MKNFNGKVAFVTGGASGIGFGLVRNFLKLGMKVAVVDFNPEHLAEVRRDLQDHKDALFVQADVGDRDQVRKAAEQTLQAFGKLHLLCNNAGVGGGGNVEDEDFEGWDRAMRVNLGGVVNGIKIIAPLMIRQGEGGHIVNTASMAGIAPLPLPGLGCYQTCKFAVRGLSESLRLSMAPHGIGVSCLFPGGTRSRIVAGGKTDPESLERANNMMVGWMDPLELGERVVEGIRANARYILTHSEFRDEVLELGALMADAFPKQQVVPPERAAFENYRRGIIAERSALPIKD